MLLLKVDQQTQIQIASETSTKKDSLSSPPLEGPLVQGQCAKTAGMKNHIFLEMGATENSIQEQWDKVLMEKQLLFVGKMTFFRCASIS